MWRWESCEESKGVEKDRVVRVCGGRLSASPPLATVLLATLPHSPPHPPPSLSLSLSLSPSLSLSSNHPPLCLSRLASRLDSNLDNGSNVDNVDDLDILDL